MKINQDTISGLKGGVDLNKELIAKRLKELRGNRERDYVADVIGVSVSALQMYETAQRIPRDHIKVKLAKFYGVSVQEIFFDNQNHNKCSETA